jgi:hypothetical protein
VDDNWGYLHVWFDPHKFSDYSRFTPYIYVDINA